MKNRLFCCFLLVTFLSTKAQQVPLFDLQTVTISVPLFLPGVMDDGTALMRNDTLFYSFHGQVFTNGYKVSKTKKQAADNSPWSLIFDLADAYSKKDSKKIIDLYEAGSKEKISNLLSGDEAPAFLKFVSEAVHSNFKILGGIEYQHGFMVFTSDDKYGLHSNFMIKDGNGYKLSALEDSSPTGWNIGLYFKFNPRPLVALKNVIVPDSISLKSTMTIIVILPEAMRWVAAYLGQPGEPVKMLVQDNGVNDLDPQKKVVRFRLPASVFPGRGTYRFYISSFNYPVQKISKNFFLPDALHVITVY